MLGIKGAMKEIARVKAAGGINAAMNTPEHLAKMKKIKNREIRIVEKIKTDAVNRELRQFGSLGLSWWEKQKMIFTGKVWRKK